MEYNIREYNNNECIHGEVFTCKRLRLLSYLRKRGFIPYATVPEVTNPVFYNWLFKNTPQLENALDEYFSKYNR